MTHIFSCPQKESIALFWWYYFQLVYQIEELACGLENKQRSLNIIEKIACIKWKWAGHTRLQDNRWTTKILEWWPKDTTRVRGRSQKRLQIGWPMVWRELLETECWKFKNRLVGENLGKLMSSSGENKLVYDDDDVITKEEISRFIL